MRRAEDTARKTEEELRTCKRQLDEQKRQLDDMEAQRRQNDRINAELKHDLAQAMAASEELRNQLREQSNSREETREGAQAVQRHAAKLEAVLKEREHDIDLQKTQVRNAQGRIASLERELDTAQVCGHVHCVCDVLCVCFVCVCVCVCSRRQANPRTVAEGMLCS